MIYLIFSICYDYHSDIFIFCNKHILYFILLKRVPIWDKYTNT